MPFLCVFYLSTSVEGFDLRGRGEGSKGFADLVTCLSCCEWRRQTVLSKSSSSFLVGYHAGDIHRNDCIFVDGGGGSGGADEDL
jgi:hypothetical protein